MPIKLNILNEVSHLDTVILGIAEDMNAPGTANPKSRFHLEHGSYPTQEKIWNEINAFEKVLVENGVKIFRPQNIKNKTQLFTRDIGFVIDDEFFISSMIKNRQPEIGGISYLLDLFSPQKIIDVSKIKNVQMEGGDVVIKDGNVYVGLSSRTNKAAADFLKKKLSGKKKIVALRLKVDRTDHFEHALHLDCVFQPVGKNHAIVYEEAIKDLPLLYKNIDLPEENIFKVNKWQFVSMYTNVFSISKDTVIIEKEFIDLKYWLIEKGFNVIEVNFRETAKLSGLLRCCTLPLIRK